MRIVKLGGSLANGSDLVAWLRLLAEPRSVPVVIVPGGGPFADAVREQQAASRFGDDVAHAMALLAMAQYGLYLQGLCSALRVESRLERVGAASDVSTPAVIWLPLDVVTQRREMEASWRFTSDSVAAWLARKLDAQRLVLVKSCPIERETGVAELAGAGIVDEAFPGMVRDARFTVHVLDRGALARARALLADGAEGASP